MKNARTIFLPVLALALLTLALGGCRSSTDRSEGNVLLTIAATSALPSSVSTNTPPDPISLTLRNITKDPTGSTSELQSIELRTLEIRYTRRDTGSRVPPSTVQGILGLVPPNGSFTLESVPVLTSDQIRSQPLNDLRTLGRDSETGTAVVVLDVSMRVFGRTLSGDEIVSDPARYTIEVRP